MATPLSSKERLLLTIDHREPDRVPLVFRSFGQVAPLETRYCWKSALERAVGLAQLGVDDVVEVQLPGFYHPDVRTQQYPV